MVALAVLLAITGLWWALALWPLPDEAPAWLVRTRAVCFGATARGLPDAAGWVALIVQPALMLALLLAFWGAELRAGLAGLARSGPGRVVLGGGAILVAIGAALAGMRVAALAGGDLATAWAAAPEPPPSVHRRLNRPAPSWPDLVDQHGDAVHIAAFHGRVVLVTFAYAHCPTICPFLVQDALRARDALAAADTRAAAPAIVVVTLDPWRDTPSRLPHIAASWGLGPDAHVLSGSVTDVAAVLDAWEVPWSRDGRTGEISHPAVTYIVDPEGRLAYAVAGGWKTIHALAEGL